MRDDGQPSQTAAMVACIRALADSGLTYAKGFHDPTAARLLPPRWARFFRWLEPRLKAMPEPRRRRILARLELMPLRTLAIDLSLSEALAEGCEQVVILGAGLDGRAYRMTELSRARVFEVDHPATQAYKRRRAAELPLTCRELAFVAVDFERERISAKLQAAGYAPEQPTAWIWEGVTMYLTDAALRATLKDVASLSAPGSVLIVQYGEPRTGRRWLPTPLSVLLWLWSEPHIGARPRERIREELERVGLTVRMDWGTADWGRRFGANADGEVQGQTRIAVASKA